MPWYHRIAGFLNHSLPQLRATRRTNLALLTVAILERRHLAISLTRTQFVIARSAATWRSRSRGGIRCPDEIAALRSQ